MKTTLVLCLLLLCVFAQEEEEHAHLVEEPVAETVTTVGQVISGSIDPTYSEQSLHTIKVGALQEKFLFIALNSEDAVPVSIGLYSNSTRNLVHACMENSLDSCYVPREELKENEIYVIMVASRVPIKYLLYAYWGQIEHLNPQQEIKFSFEKANPTQIFHFELGSIKDFEQIRLVLKPETSRTANDQLKIYANAGFSLQPTSQKHDFESVHVWGDAEAIFITKQQLKGEKGLAIFIAGSAQTVYTFKGEVIEKSHHDLSINQTIHEYIQAGKTTLYHVNFSTDSTVDSYAIKASLFTGEIQIGFYYDQKMQQPYTKQPMMYMSDVEFNFKKTDLKDKDSIYMRVKCADSSSTFVLAIQGRVEGKAFEITENIYEFLPVAQKEAVFFYYREMSANTEYEGVNELDFEMSVIMVQGTFSIDFYACYPTSSEEDCKNYNAKKFNESAKKLNATMQEVGSKNLYRFTAGKDLLRRMNDLEGRLLVVCVISEREKARRDGAIALEYSNPKSVRFLRENRAFQDRTRMQETKYYKYLNNDPNIHSVRIFVHEVSGLTKVKVQRNDFRVPSKVDTHIEPSAGDKTVYTINENLKEPVYISVTGLVSSIYSITVSALHPDHPITSSMTLAQDIEYEMKILPYQFLNVQVHPIRDQAIFEFSSEGGSVVVCQLDEQGLCSRGLDNKPAFIVGSKGQVPIMGSNIRSIKLRIGNYVNSTYSSHPDNYTQTSLSNPVQILETVRVKMIYHSSRDKHCEIRKINKVYSEVAQTGGCYKFHLPLVSDIEIFQARQDNGASFQLYFVCDTKVQPTFSDGRMVVSGSTISQYCSNPDDLTFVMVVADISPQIHTDIRLDYSVEYKNDTITLADGIGYRTKGRAAEGQIRTFFFEVLDHRKPTEISLFGRKGVPKFYVDITSEAKKYNAVTESKAMLSSKDSQFYSNPSIAVTERDYSAAGCDKDCVIIVSVYSNDKVGSEIEYTIQATQNEVILKEDEIRSDFLPKGSYKYYKYEVRTDKTDLFIKASDNGRDCEKMYLSKTAYPSPSNYFISETSGTLLQKKVDKGMYYLSVEALEDCEYHVSVSEDNASLTKLQFGSYYDLKLGKGEGKWFYTHHMSSSSFKIISLLKYGSVQIFANSTEMNRETFASIKDSTFDLGLFSFKTGYKNTLAFQTGDPGFCNDCNYLIYINASQMTETTLYLGGENSKVSLENNKVLYDEIQNKDSASLATFYKVSPGSLLVKVHSGKIKVDLSYLTQRWSKQFQKNKKEYKQLYNFTKDESSYNPINIKVTATELPAYYSIQMKPDADARDYLHKLNPGEHTYMALEKGEKQCLTGYLKDKNEEIYFTQDADAMFKLKDIKIQAKLNGKETNKFETQLVGNIFTVKFLFDSIFFTEVVPYELCLTPVNQQEDKSMLLIAFQNSKVNLIHSDTEALIHGESTFVIYPKGSVIINLFECKGKASIFYANSESQLETAKAKDLEGIAVSGQSHAFRVEQFSTLYLKVKSPLSTMSWTAYDPENEKGVGYSKYAIGTLEYKTSFNKITFLVGPVYKQKETSTTVKNIQYTIYISDSKQKLQQAVMCEQIEDDKVLKIAMQTQKDVAAAPGTLLSVGEDKSRLTKAFDSNQTLYFSAVADLTLLPPGKKVQEEHYRFVYYSQEVSSDSLRQGQFEKLNIGFMIVLVVVAAIGVIVILIIFVKFVVPALGLLKNRMLVEERDEDKDNQSIPVPPSSDRNQIGNNIDNDRDGQVGTQDRMSR